MPVSQILIELVNRNHFVDDQVGFIATRYIQSALHKTQSSSG